MTKQEQSAAKTDQLERTVLAYMLVFPSETFEAIEKIGIRREDFTNGEYASAFSAMLIAGPEDPDKLNRAIVNAVSGIFSSNEKTNAFTGLAVMPHLAADACVDFAQHVILLQHARKTMAVYGDASISPGDIPEVFDRLNAEMRDRLAALDRFRGTAPAETNGEFDGTVPTPEKLMDMPGFVNTLAAYTYATSPRPNRVLAFAGALAMLAHLVGRKYTDRRNTRPNLYLVALADSGVGKDPPRRVNKALADKIDMLDTIQEQIGSGEGLEDALFEIPKLLFQMDEFDTLLNALKDSSAITERMYTYLLTFFSESATSHALRRKALSQEAKQAMANNPTAVAQRKSPKIYSPSLTLFSTAIPNRFYSALTMRALDNGLLARCLILEAGLRGPAGDGPFDVPLPDSAVSFARTTAAQDRELQWGASVTPHVVPDAPDVAKAAKDVRDAADKLYDAAAKANDAAGKAVWNRGYEITCKLALLYALSENLLDPKITAQGFAWGWELVQYSSKRMLAMADAYIAVDRDDDDCNKIMRYLASCPDNRCTRSIIGRALHLSKKRLDAAEETLKDRHMISVSNGSYGASVYRAMKQKKGR